MRLLLLLALAPQVVAAADPPPVPKTWEKLSAGGTREGTVAVRGGYTIWVDKVLVPGTERHRAQSFTETLYRFKAGDTQPEKLEQISTTRGLYPVLGPNGEIANGWFADCQTLYVLGLKPIPMPKDARFAAQEWTKDGLVCAAERWVYKKPGQPDGWYETAVLRFPIDRAKNALGEPKVLRPWLPLRDDDFKPDFSNGRAFARGDFVAHTGTVPNPDRPGFPRTASEVWDTKQSKMVWRAEITVAAADDTHAYWFPEGHVVARRRLDGTGKTERFALPKESIRFDVQSPKLFALMKQEKEWVLALFDLTTGDRAEYDLRLTGAKPGYNYSGSGPVRRYSVWFNGDSSDGWHNSMPLGLDAATGEARMIRDKTVYRIPVAKKLPADAKPKWEPVPAT